jgi:hypothetical protein
MALLPHWPLLDRILAVYTVLIIFGPWPWIGAMFLALIFGDIDFTDISTDRAIYYSGTMVLSAVLAMMYFSQRQPLFFCRFVYWTLLLYVDILGPVLSVIFCPRILLQQVGWTLHHDRRMIYLSLSIPLTGCLFCILVGRGILLAKHDYSVFDTLPNNAKGGVDAKLRSIMSRGLDERQRRYQYLPKTHLMVTSCISILVGIVFAAIVWPISLSITIPITIVSMVDVSYHSCFKNITKHTTMNDDDEHDNDKKSNKESTLPRKKKEHKKNKEERSIYLEEEPSEEPTTSSSTHTLDALSLSAPASSKVSFVQQNGVMVAVPSPDSPKKSKKKKSKRSPRQ